MSTQEHDGTANHRQPNELLSWQEILGTIVSLLIYCSGLIAILYKVYAFVLNTV